MGRVYSEDDLMEKGLHLFVNGVPRIPGLVLPVNWRVDMRCTQPLTRAAPPSPVFYCQLTGEYSITQAVETRGERVRSQALP